MREGPGGGVKEVAEQIRELGADCCIIATDFGVYTLPEPVEGLREFIACLLDLGISVDDISKLVKTNPERLLGLNSG
jgi:microsomal dipeptidase-like Zn-dependent dipeptidase